MTQQEILDRVQFIGELRGLAPGTLYNYGMYIRLYQDHFDKPADQLDIRNVQEYLHHNLVVRGIKKSSVDSINSSLRFLYHRVLENPLDEEKIPRHGRSRHLPDILIREEVQRLFDSTRNLRDKCIFMTAYGAGLRVSEVSNLRVPDIDSEKMQIFIRNGKGEKDRYAILSQVNLEALREYWKAYRPREWLFCQHRYKDQRIGIRGIQIILERTLERSGIQKHVTMHTLRHSFATHLLEDNVNLFHIKQLLGHTRMSTTCRYLQMRSAGQAGVQSPLDKLSSHE